MNHYQGIVSKFRLALPVVGGSLCFTMVAHAERIRHCDYSLSAVAETVDIHNNTVRGEVLVIGGQSAGRHGGVQANTARRRARDRINSCVAQWNVIGEDQASSEVPECTNSNLSAVPGFDVETAGLSLRETLTNAFPELCSTLQCSEEVLVRISDARLLVTGDSGCASTQTYEVAEMLVGELCGGL